MLLIDYLNEQGLSQRGFAAECGLSAAAISRIVNGSRFPSLETMRVILVKTKGRVTANDFLQQSISSRD